MGLLSHDQNTLCLLKQQFARILVECMLQHHANEGFQKSFHLKGSTVCRFIIRPKLIKRLHIASKKKDIIWEQTVLSPSCHYIPFMTDLIAVSTFHSTKHWLMFFYDQTSPQWLWMCLSHETWLSSLSSVLHQNKSSMSINLSGMLAESEGNIFAEHKYTCNEFSL